jgi:hypothetical protein
MNPLYEAQAVLDTARTQLTQAQRGYQEVIDALAVLARPIKRGDLSLEAWAGAEAERTARIPPLEAVKQQRGRALEAARSVVQHAEQGLAAAEERRTLLRQRAAARRSDAERYEQLHVRLAAVRTELRALRGAAADDGKLDQAAMLIGEVLSMLHQGAAEYAQAQSALTVYGEGTAYGAAVAV